MNGKITAACTYASQVDDDQNKGTNNKWEEGRNEGTNPKTPMS